MALQKLQLNFERNSCNNFSNNRCHRRTDDGRITISWTKFFFKKWAGDMVDRYLSPKFGINLFSGIRENDVYGRWTADDGRPRDDSSSAVQ